MENNQELFKQAILDAKAVRETAMAAARTTLAEHFEPFIKQTMQETLSKDMEEGSDQMEEDLQENDLDAILKELDSLSEDMAEEGADMEEGHVPEDGYVGKASKGETGYDEKAKVSRGGTGYPEKAKSSIHEADGDDDEDAEADDEAEEVGKDVTKDIEAGEDEGMGGDAQEVVDITVGELKDIIRDVFTQLQGGGEDLGDAGAAFDAGTEMADDMDMGAEDDSKEISLEEILAELEAEEKKMDEAAHVPGNEIDPKAGDVYAVGEMKKELKEAVKTIKALRTELNEVNLFSAKMLYVNKLFKSKNLTESQKTKVVNAFDRATSVKEVENTYKTLLESIGESKKSTLRESVGFASKPIGNAPARPIVEADAFVTRWQQLAGIK